MSLFIRLANWCVSSKLPITLLLLVTVFFGWQLGNLGINASPYIVNKQHPLRISQQVLSETFTNTGEQVLVVLDLGEDLFSPDMLKRIALLSSDLEQLKITDKSDTDTLKKLANKYDLDSQYKDIISEGIDLFDRDKLLAFKEALPGSATPEEYAHIDTILLKSNPVLKVRSLSTVENLVDDNDFLIAEKLLASLPETKTQATSTKLQALDNKLFENILIDENAHVTNLQVELKILGDDSPNMILAYQAILDLLAQHEFSEHAYLSGVPVVNAEIGQVVDNDNKQFFPFVILVILAILYCTFRKLSVVLLSLAVAILTMVWTMGSMALLDVKQNIVTAILPIFLISIAVADSIHYISAYLFRINNNTNKAVADTNAHLMQPMLLTTITTIFGFLALSYSDLIFIKEFGLFVALGVGYAFVITIVLLPTLISHLKLAHQDTNKTGKDLFANWTITIINSCQARPRRLAAIVIVFISACVFSASNLRVDNHSTASFDQDAKIRLDEAKITNHLGGIYPVNFWFESKSPRQMIRPDVIRAIETIQQHINQFSQVGYTVSPTDFIKRINKVLTNGNHELPRPLEKNLVSQYLLLYENSNGQDLRNVLDMSYSNARLVALFKTDQATQFEEVIDSVKNLADKTLPSDIELKITGYGAEIVLATELVVHGQITSICIAILLIGGLMIIYFKSVIVGLAGIIPLTLTILINFALMSLAGVPLDIGTALISGIAFGIGIDYAIHFITILKNEAQKQGSIKQAIEATIGDTARPILVNSLSLGLGFLVLAMSDFASLRQLGYFVSISMIACALLTLFILPMIFTRVPPRLLQTDNLDDSAPTQEALEQT